MAQPNPTDSPFAALPKRWSATQRVKNTLLYYLLRMLVGVLTRLPFAILRSCLKGLARTAYWLVPSERHKVLAHLEIAFPDKSAAERRHIAKAFFEHLALCVAEGLKIHHLFATRQDLHLDAHAKSVLDAALERGKGVLVITGHIGNWELFAQIVAHDGYPVQTVAKPLYDPRLTQWIANERQRYGLEIIWRRQGGIWQKLQQGLKDNKIVAFLNDQDTKDRGEFVPFFGCPAHTPTAAAALAIESNASMVFCYSYRDASGHHRFVFRAMDDANPKIANEDAQDAPDTVTLTRRFNAELEQAIGEHPTQWLWLHRRWKKKPLPQHGNSGIRQESC